MNRMGLTAQAYLIPGVRLGVWSLINWVTSCCDGRMIDRRLASDSLKVMVPPIAWFVLDRENKGPVINYGEGGGYKMGKLQV